MTIVVLQPGYLPWLGYFEQLARADVFVHYDDVQYDRHGWRNRNRIRTPGEPGWSWLTVPVRTAGTFGEPICAMEIDDRGSRWGLRHWRTIEHHYRACPFFKRYAADLQDVLLRRWRRLVDLDLMLVELLADQLGIRSTTTLRSSALGVPSTVGGSERLVAICRSLGGDRYYTGAAARAYLDTAPFKEAGIEVVFQDYKHPRYPQRYPGFVSHLSVIDLLFNAGPESLALLAEQSPRPR